MPLRLLPVVAASLIALSACGSDAVAHPSTSASPGGATPAASGGTPLTAPPDSTPVAATVIPGCTYVPASKVGSALGMTVADPALTVNRRVTVCQYSSGQNTSAVLVRFETQLALSDFMANERAFAAHGQPTTDISGLGEAAYTSMIGQGSSATATVVTYKNGTSLLISAGTSLDRIESLARQVLTAL